MMVNNKQSTQQTSNEVYRKACNLHHAKIRRTRLQTVISSFALREQNSTTNEESMISSVNVR